MAIGRSGARKGRSRKYTSYSVKANLTMTDLSCSGQPLAALRGAALASPGRSQHSDLPNLDLWPSHPTTVIRRRSRSSGVLENAAAFDSFIGPPCSRSVSMLAGDSRAK